MVLRRLLKFFDSNLSREYPIGITTPVMKTISESAKSTHPHEFICFLTGEPAEKYPSIEESDGRIITDFYIIPGTKSGPTSASVKDINIPITTDIVGTLHTHPSGSIRPSNEDMNLFRKHQVNIIMGHPYTVDSWMAYSSRSEELPSFPLLDISES